MKGMDTVIALRRSGKKPRAVFVYLVEHAAPDQLPVSHHGHAVVDVEGSDGIADIDFRPLHGLRVFLGDITFNADRFAKLRSAIEAIGPERVIVPAEEFAC